MDPLSTALQNFRHRLRSLPIPRRRFFFHVDRVAQPVSRIGVPEAIVSRGLCRYKCFDLAHVPAGKRLSALVLGLPQWAPFAANGYAVAWRQGSAMVWCWDRAKLAAELVRSGQAPSMPALPESLLRAPAETGLRLVPCLDGFEGQHWSGGILRASRWWPSQPQSGDWISFQRSAGMVPAEQSERVVASDSPLGYAPWAPFSNESDGASSLSSVQSLGYSLALLALLVPTLVLGYGHAQLRSAISERNAQIADFRARGGPVLQARDAALNDAFRYQALQSLADSPSPLQLMAAVARALPGDGTFVREWDQNGPSLRFTLASAKNISGSGYVRALEHSGLFADVKAISNADPRIMGFSVRILAPGGADQVENAGSVGAAQ